MRRAGNVGLAFRDVLYGVRQRLAIGQLDIRDAFCARDFRQMGRRQMRRAAGAGRFGRQVGLRISARRHHHCGGGSRHQFHWLHHNLPD